MSVEKYIFKEPSAGRRRDYRPWEATPLDLRHPKVQKHQDDVKRRFEDLIMNGRPSTVTPEVAQYIHSVFTFYDAKREARNIASFHARDVQTDPLELDPQTLERSMLGIASIADLRVTARALEMPAIELAKLSYFYGHRTEYLEPMQTDVVDVFGKLALVTYKVDTLDMAATHAVLGKPDLQYDAVTFRKKSRMVIPEEGTILKRSDVLTCRVNGESSLTQEAAEVIMRFHRAAEAQQDGNGAQLTALKRVYPEFIEPIIETGPTHPDVMAGTTLVYEHGVGHKAA